MQFEGWQLAVLRAAKRVEVVREAGVWTCTIELVTPSGMARLVRWADEDSAPAVQTAVYLAHQWLEAYGAAQPRQPRQEPPQQPSRPKAQSQPQQADSGRPAQPQAQERGPITIDNVAERRWPFGRGKRMADFSDIELDKARSWLERGPGRNEDPRKRKLGFVLIKLEQQRRSRKEDA